MPRRLPAARAYLAYEFLWALFFATFSTLSGVYRVQEADLSALQLVLVGTVLEGSVFVGEIPTGVVADVYSRRLSVLIGVVVMGCGFALEGLFPVFGVILIAQVVWGLGYTFISGASTAWIVDEVGEGKVGPVFLRGSQMAHIGALLGIGLSVGLGTIALGLPLVAAGIGMAGIGVAGALLMPETGFEQTPAADRSSFQRMSDTFVAGLRTVRGRPFLIMLLALGLVNGLWSEGFDRLWELHFLTNFDFPTTGDVDPVVWFGIINAAAMLLGLGVVEFIRRRFNHADPRTPGRLLLALNGGLVLALAAFGLAQGFGMAAGLFLTARLLRQAQGPLFMTWANRGLDRRVRATVLSMRGQMDSLGQFIGGPFIGAVASGAGVRTGIVLAAAMLSPVLPLYALALRQLSRTPAASPVAASPAPATSDPP